MSRGDGMAPRNKTTKHRHSDGTRSFDNRQLAFEALKELCQELEVCAACGASAGMYLSAEAAGAIGFDRAAFLDLAAKVWDDVTRQRSNKPSN